jgi:Trp operon repressor
MYGSPNLSEQEWTLLIDLLEREQDELPVEIHHCRVASFREHLHERLQMVQGLLERLHTTAAV